MYCSQCGKKTNSGDKFCSDCGHELKITDNNYKSSHPTDGRFFSEQFIRDFNDYLIQSNDIVFEFYSFQDIKYLQNYMMNHQFPIDSFPAILMLEIPDHVKNREEIENTKIFDALFFSPLWDVLIKRFPGIEERPKYNREDFITYLSNRFSDEKDLELVNKIVDEYDFDSNQFLVGAIDDIISDSRKLEKIFLSTKKAGEITRLFREEALIIRHLNRYFYDSIFVIDVERTNSKITKIWLSLVQLVTPHRLQIMDYLMKNYDMPLTTKVAGVTFEGRQKTISEIYFKFDKLTMNPDNEFNGIQLTHMAPYGNRNNADESLDIGFIPKEQVNKVKYLMKYFNLECLLVDVTGGGGDFNYGVKIMIYVKSLEKEVYDQVGYDGWENTDTISDAWQVSDDDWEGSVDKNNMRKLVSSKLNGPTYINNYLMEAKEFNLGDSVEDHMYGFGKVIGINPPRQITVSFVDKGIKEIWVPSSSLKKI